MAIHFCIHHFHNKNDNKSPFSVFCSSVVAFLSLSLSFYVGYGDFLPCNVSCDVLCLPCIFLCLVLNLVLVVVVVLASPLSLPCLLSFSFLCRLLSSIHTLCLVVSFSCGLLSSIPILRRALSSCYCPIFCLRPIMYCLVDAILSLFFACLCPFLSFAFAWPLSLSRLILLFFLFRPFEFPLIKCKMLVI
jgi:hypothetical protein